MRKKVLVLAGYLVLLAGLLIPPVWAQQAATPKADQGVEAPLPSSFDLRTVDAMTPVKAQKGGTCWAHGTMAAIESNLLISGVWKKLGGIGDPAMSEYHLDWWNGFNKFKNNDLANADKDPSGLTAHNGGDYRVAVAYISRGDGIVAVPLDADNKLDTTGWFAKAPSLQDGSFKRWYVRDVEWFVMGDNLEGIDVIKRRLMTEGAIGTCYAAGKTFISKDNVHYQPADTKNKPNHAVAIAGWDDSKISTDDGKKAPPKPGAWLIKNSWGAKRGDKGYYWISYYDKYCCRDAEMGAVSFRNIEPMQYSHVYYHDYHGWRGTMPNIAKAFNAFTAADRQEIRAVSFYTAKDNVNYTYKIYKGFDKGQLQNEVASHSGSIRYTGFHTLDLITPLKIQKGERFFVYVELSDGGHPIDRTSEIPVLLSSQQKKEGHGPNGPMVKSKANPGESFYHDGKGWRDLYDYRFDNPDWATFDRTANFCMKALAVEAK